MKKIFTFIFCAVLAISSWGEETEKTIGGTGSNDTNVPISLSSSYSASQSIYTVAEIEDAGIAVNASISKIGFKYASSTEYTRSIKVYITNKESDVAATNGSSYKFDKVTTDDLYFDGSITTPTTSSTFYYIPLSKNFVWDGKSNICIIVCDNTGTSGGSWKSHKASSVTSNPGRCIYSTGYLINPTSSSTNTGSKADFRPVISLTYSTGSIDPTPSLTATCSNTDFGTFAKAYETKIATITVTGENLTEDVSITADAGMTVSPTNLSKEDVMADGGAIVTVTTTNAFVTNKKVMVSANNISKTITFTGTEAEFYQPMSTTFFNTAYEQNHFYINYNAATTIAEVNTANNQFKNFSNANFMVDYSAVPGNYSVNGKITNLYGKFLSENIFQAFAFDYEGPVVTGITIDENTDNSTILAENDGQTKTVNINRSFTANMYNTICLPITVSKSSIEGKFGAGTSLIRLNGSSYTDGVITLEFAEVAETSNLEAGKPYLIKPIQNVTNPVFTNYEVSKDVYSTTTEFVDFIPVMSPTELPQSKEILFMGQNNELFWPTEAGTLKGLRCYFKVNFQGTPEGSAIAGAPVRMSIIKSNGITTDLPMTWSQHNSPMIMYKNQLFIVKDNKLINISGQTIQ